MKSEEVTKVVTPHILKRQGKTCAYERGYEMANFFNQATLSYSGGTVNSNVTSGELIEVLSATKTAVIGSYSQGSEVTYVINLTNSGSAAITGLIITDDLGAYENDTVTLRPLDYIADSVNYFINGVPQAAPTVDASDSLVISGLTIPANGVATVIYAARANSFAPPLDDGTIVNTAVINGGGITEITVSETVNAETEPRLNISKAICPATVTENGQITYTFVIQNTGNSAADAADNVVITDTFDPRLSNIIVTYNGTVWASPANYTYDETTGVFTTTAGSITVPAATYTQDPDTGSWVVDPGTVTITVTGTI